MTTWYFDSVNGLDANAGTSASSPKQSYTAFVLAGLGANGDTFLFKRGTTQTITSAFISFRNGTSDTVRSRFAVYGDSDTNYCTWKNPTAAGGFVIIMANRSYIDVEDMRFDAQGVNGSAIYCAVQSATNVVGHRLYRCHFYNSTGSGFNVGIEGGKTGTPSGLLFEDCEFYDNGAHGLILSGCNSSIVRRCKFYRNGALGADGGHGFSSGAGKTNATSGWTNASGTIWQRTLAVNELDVYYVQTSVYPYGRPRRTAGTQTAPAVGEFGVSAGILYLNINSATNPATQGVVYAWKRAYGLRIEDCEAYDNVWNVAAPFHEGHGFAFDDFTEDSFFLRCLSYNNQGAGFSINRGDRNRIVGNIAYGNWQSGIVSNPTDNTIIANNTFYGNNAGTEAHAGEMQFNGFCKDAIISNNIIISSVAYGISRETSDTGFTGSTNAISGYLTAAEKNASVTGTITTAPALDVTYRPTAAEIKRAGTAFSGKDYYGKQLYNPPNIGAVDDVTNTPRYVLRP